jgi:site-specific DNA-cytosine methylase
MQINLSILMKYAAVIPLIGGMVLGAKKATGQDPEFILSYEPFQSNDSHCRENFPEVPYGLIDDNGVSWDRPFTQNYEGIDMVVSLCPCAGLSALNSSTKEGSEKARGADAIQNEWMYKSSEYILENVQPQVLWGENAPGLYTALGKKVADRLHEIGKKHGYSFSMIKTSTSHHGIPQNRTRSFYFFWKGETAPLLEWIDREKQTLEEYISKTPSGPYTEKFFMKEPLTDDPIYQWLRDVEQKTPHEAALEGNRSMLIYIFREQSRVNSVMAYLEAREDAKAKKYLELVKRATQKRVWDSTPHINANDITAVVGRTLQLSVHPTEHRWMNVQELMWLMGMNGEFKLAHEGFQQISQNVPVNTAADWTLQVLKWMEGGLQDSGVDYLKQDNTVKRIDTKILQTSKTLF